MPKRLRMGLSLLALWVMAACNGSRQSGIQDAGSQKPWVVDGPAGDSQSLQQLKQEQVPSGSGNTMRTAPDEQRQALARVIAAYPQASNVPEMITLENQFQAAMDATALGSRYGTERGGWEDRRTASVRDRSVSASDRRILLYEGTNIVRRPDLPEDEFGRGRRTRSEADVAAESRRRQELIRRQQPPAD